MKLTLKRPLAIFDLETTGLNITKDRIVEIAVIKINVDGSEESYSKRVNPEMPIPLETSMIHGIYYEDIKDSLAILSYRGIIDLDDISPLYNFIYNIYHDNKVKPPDLDKLKSHLNSLRDIRYDGIWEAKTTIIDSYKQTLLKEIDDKLKETENKLK